MAAPDRKLVAAMAQRLSRGLSQVAAGGGGLLDFIPRVSPQFSRPVHLAPLVRLFERAVAGEPVRAVVSAPPQHGKTEAMLHGIAWALTRDPSLPMAYATYGASLSESKSKRARGLVREAGVELSGDSESASEWLTRAGGGLRATGVGGSLTGHPAKIVLVDDPYKNRVDAESGAYRRRVEDWFEDVAKSRLAPGGSMIVWATRWTPNDLSGKLISDGWEYVRLPAIEDASLEAFEAVEKALREATSPVVEEALRGELARAFERLRVLWPERWAGRVMELLERRSNPYTWASLYMGSPRPRGGTVFHDVYRYDPSELPRVGYVDGLGVDLAYAGKDSSDASAMVKGRRFGGQLFIRSALKVRVPAPVFVRRVGEEQAAEGGIPCWWYASTTERGAAELAIGHGATITPMLARADKFVRAQGYAGAWNEGRVLVPSDAGPWLDTFLDAHLNFTGIGDEDDDEVDAAVALYDGLVPEVVIRAQERRQPASEIGSDMRFGGMSDRRGY